MVVVTTLIPPWCSGTSWSSLFLQRLSKACFIITTSIPKYITLMKRSQGTVLNAMFHGSTQESFPLRIIIFLQFLWKGERKALQEVTKAIRERTCSVTKAAAALLPLLVLELSSQLLLLYFMEGKPPSLRVYSQAAFPICGQKLSLQHASLLWYLGSKRSQRPLRLSITRLGFTWRELALLRDEFMPTDLGGP